MAEIRKAADTQADAEGIGYTCMADKRERGLFGEENKMCSVKGRALN